MSKEVINCSNCQQVIKFDEKGDKYFSLTIKKQDICLCPSCWELKKDDYKEQY